MKKATPRRIARNYYNRFGRFLSAGDEPLTLKEMFIAVAITYFIFSLTLIYLFFFY